MADSTTTPSTTASEASDWSFARRPFWLFSHLFALLVVVLFVNLGLWQLDRHDRRQAENAVIEQRLASAQIEVDGADDLAEPPAGLDFQPVAVVGSYLDGQFVTVANRSQGGTAGVHLVGLVELEDGTVLAVNRGFLPTGDEDLEPAAVERGPVRLEGWLRSSVERARFGAVDSGEGSTIPRLDTASIAARLGRDVPAVWLQLADSDPTVVTFPDPIPLPSLDSGPHLSYAGQWFIFATLGVLFYGALLRRQARSPGPPSSRPDHDDRPDHVVVVSR